MSTSQPPVDRYAYAPSRRGHDAGHPAQSFAMRAHELAQRESQVRPRFPDPERVFAGPGYQSPVPPRNGVATAAVYTSAFGVIFFPLAFAGLVMGIIGWVKSSDRMGVGRHQARAAVTISLITLSAWGILYLYFFS